MRSCRRFCSLALLGQNASERDVRSGLIGHYLDGLVERIGCFRKFILLLVDASQDGPTVPVFWPQPQRGFEMCLGVVKMTPLHFQDAEGKRRIWGIRVEARSDLQFFGRCGEIVLQFKSETEIVVQFVGFGSEVASPVRNSLIASSRSLTWR